MLFIFFLFGTGWYLWINEYIIIRSFSHNVSMIEYTKKTTRSLTIWHHKTPSMLQSESVQSIWSDTDHCFNITHISQAFFDVMVNEHIIMHSLLVQSVVIDSQTDTLYLSLDQSPFNSQSSIHKKWILIEDLLLTLKKNGITQKYIQLLIHHQPYHDTHIDFSRPWPMQGFLSAQKHAPV